MNRPPNEQPRTFFLVVRGSVRRSTPETERWWKETDPCQQPPSTKKDPGIWMDLERVFFLE